MLMRITDEHGRTYTQWIPKRHLDRAADDYRFMGYTVRRAYTRKEERTWRR